MKKPVYPFHITTRIIHFTSDDIYVYKTAMVNAQAKCIVLYIFLINRERMADPMTKHNPFIFSPSQWSFLQKDQLLKTIKIPEHVLEKNV